MRQARVLGGPSARAAFGGNLSLAWLLLSVAQHSTAFLPDAAGTCVRGSEHRWC
jgi:hypothetical protein